MDFINSTLIGTLIGACLSFYLNQRQVKKQSTNQLNVNCRILLEETNRHLYWFSNLASKDFINVVNNENFDEWDILKYKLSDMPFCDFEIIMEHFQGMLALREITKTCKSKSMKIENIPEEIILPKKKICWQAHLILWSFCYENEPNKIKEYYSSKKAYERAYSDSK